MNLNRKNQSTYRWEQKRKAAGLCVQCGSPELSSKVLCESCLEQRRVRSKAAVKNARDAVFSHYGQSCACCGERTEEFLTIDHVNDDGAAHRKELGISSGRGFYEWLIKSNFPIGFQTLCWNCNCSKSRRGYCPHTQFPNFVGDWQLATQAVA